MNFCNQCRARLQIQDRYRALRVIGQGGFGKTFLAQDESKPSQTRCVIKQFAFETINPNASQRDLNIAVRLFEEEAKRLDELGNHPQIPELLSFTIHEEKQYLIQEFIDGETLEQELRRVKAFSEQQVKNVLVEVLQILEFVHGKSVIHRDISPDNIIRRKSDGKLVLVDFGAAKHATATLLAKTGTGIGKLNYGSPEQMLGKSVFQSDLFSLGVTCLHLLTNVEPFEIYDVLENEYQWRNFLNGKVVNDKFGELLDRLIAYKVKLRPNSVIEVLQELGVRQSPTIRVPNNNNPMENLNKFTIKLLSAKGIDYSELEQFLKEKKWCEASDLTAKLMLKVSNREEDGYLDNEHIDAFPCEDLRTIDQLWVHYSNGEFGFSVQKILWKKVRGEIGKSDSLVSKRFALKVGWWHQYEDRHMTYNEFVDSINIKNTQSILSGSFPRHDIISRRDDGLVFGVLFWMLDGISGCRDDYHERFDNLSLRLVNCNL